MNEISSAQDVSQEIQTLRESAPPQVVVRCGMEVCPTCAQVRENEAGEIRELRLKLSQVEESLSRQEESYEKCSEINDMLRSALRDRDKELSQFKHLKSDNEKLLDDAKRLRIERDRALQSAAYLKSQYDALQDHFSFSKD